MDGSRSSFVATATGGLVVGVSVWWAFTMSITKRTAAKSGDAYARCRTGSTSGRGSVAGWTPCPLCCAQPLSSTYTSSSSSSSSSNINSHTPDNAYILNILSNLPANTKSVKLFSHGRGLAAHLHSVHTPWKPGKAELKRRRALQKRSENEKRRLQGLNAGRSCDMEERQSKRLKLTHQSSNPSATNGEDVANNSKKNIQPTPETLAPSTEETEQWNQRVMDIVALVESEARKKEQADATNSDETSTDATTDSTTQQTAPTEGVDRSGKLCLSYRYSLPPFLAAAADGDLVALQKCIRTDEGTEDTACDKSNTKEQINQLLSIRDRNGSTAEHWAAGGGHIECLLYLLVLRDEVSDLTKDNSNDTQQHQQEQQQQNKRIRRRRDGKTSLHYAARNGHNECIDLILSRQDAPPVDVSSGDGTTPLHLACYGGHPSTVKHLIETHQANANALNEWGCGTAHWTAMSLGNEGEDAVIELCNYLRSKCSTDFVARQKQGHTPLHKAASRKNRCVIEWLAGRAMGSVVKSECNHPFSTKEMKLMGSPDEGGNLPSDIWLSVGGSEVFGQWMKDVCEW